jgi:hypothetical protein
MLLYLFGFASVMLLFLILQKQTQKTIIIEKTIQDSAGPSFPVYTQGEPAPFRQLGILTNNDLEPKVIALYGRRTHRRSNKFNYYGLHDDIRLPVSEPDGDGCEETRGCDEVYDDDELIVNPYGTYQVEIY